MAVTYALLKASYERYNRLATTAALYETLGWEDLADKPQWANTCAVRLHLALLDAGEHIDGRFEILAGRHKGGRVEVSQMRMAEKLDRSRLGPAIRLTHEQLHGDDYTKIAGRKGIASFQGMAEYAGGHIDVMDAHAWTCMRSCYLGARSIWFWPLA